MLLEITPEGEKYLDEIMQKMTDTTLWPKDKKKRNSAQIDRYTSEAIVLLYFMRRPETAEDVIAENRRKLPNSDGDWKGILRGLFESGYIVPVGLYEEIR